MGGFLTPLGEQRALHKGVLCWNHAGIFLLGMEESERGVSMWEKAQTDPSSSSAVTSLLFSKGAAVRMGWWHRWLLQELSRCWALQGCSLTGGAVTALMQFGQKDFKL